VPALRTLQQLVRYNGWANRRVFDVCRTAAPGLLSEAAKGTIGSVEETLKHMVAVEEGYLALLQDQDLGETFGDREAYLAQDGAWFARRSPEIAEGYLALVDGRDDAWLEGRLQVPWFDFPMTRRDGLVQVLMHSAQHRAQVLSALGASGVTVPDVDYVTMLAEEHRSPAG
jgi:uncharacterized damage-inducible protein DinB